MAWAIGMAVAIVSAAAGTALARNPHCSGGILYVTQGMRDKDRGDAESYQRQMNKAVSELQQCVAEDPNEYESLGYLGWAYAELDSTCPAGKAFDASIKGAEAKGDKKKADWARGNRDHYWAVAFNKGVGAIQDAQNAYADFTKKPEDEAETTLKKEAEKHYNEAITSLNAAACLKPGDPKTIRNLGSCYAFMGDYPKAAAVFDEGLKQAPGDSMLLHARQSVQVNMASSLIDEKKYDEAITFFTGLIKSEPNNPNHYTSLADAYFRRAQTKDGAARTSDFTAAGDAYGKAADLKPDDADLRFNAALAYQNASVWDKAEAQWRLAAKSKPDDPEVLGALGSVLAEEKKFDESVKVLQHAVVANPKNKNVHRQLGNVYTKAGNNGKATEELMVYLALEKGQTADAAAKAKAAPAGSDAAKVATSDGTPDQVNTWAADQEGQYETWFYWTKMRAYTFKAGKMVQRSDWSTAETASSGTKK
jgi:tetratricopeptide (TPR) repeat protein